MKCRELFNMLNEYLDGEADPALREEFQKHLDHCGPCQVVVDNVRQTITVYRNGQTHELSPALCSRMREVLKRRWEAVYAH